YTNINLLQEAIPAFFKQNHKELTHITTVRADLSNTNSKITDINKTLVNFKESLDEYENRLKSLENTVKELLNHIKSISPKQERQPSYQEIMKQKLEEERLKRMKG